jgi:hypothetical protein
MSRVQDTIRQLIADRGWSVLDNPDVFLGMLEDYGAFRDEDPQDREILRNQIKSGGAMNILSSYLSNQQSMNLTPNTSSLPLIRKQNLKPKGKRYFRKWLSDNSEDICAVLFFICLVLAVISLFATFCGLIYSSPNTASWAWALLGSILTGGLVLLLMVIFDV